VTALLAPHGDATAEALLAANQRALMAEVAAVRALLEPSGVRASAGAAPDTGDPPPDAPAEHATALDAVCACYGLSGFERRIVVLCAAPELDGNFRDVLTAVHQDPSQAEPTFGLALAVFPEPHWSALTPWGPLRYWRLVEPGPGSLTAAPLQIDEWLLHALAGAGGIDTRLTPIVQPLAKARSLPASAERAASALAAAWLDGAPDMPVLTGGAGAELKRAVFTAACARLDCQAYVLSAPDLPASAAERHELARLWSRDALLDRAALLIEGEDDETWTHTALERFAAHLQTPAALAATGTTRVRRRSQLTIAVGKPTPAEQRELWLTALGGDLRHDLPGLDLDRLVAQFDLDPATIAGIARRVAGEQDADSGRPRPPGPPVWKACRNVARGGLDDLAQRLESTATFEDLVLPEAQSELLRDILSQARHRARVYDKWQMAGPSRRGLGISALFAGPSGTGKTLAAEVLANAMDLDLYRIDLSQVVSKYIGETEKNLRRVFEAAGDSGAVLLFDEADALFGKRSEVRDSHDRYANVEISYLLQAMESYRGLAVLTTNMRSALDSAFLRRLRFVVTFPFPGPAERARIWMRAFPPATPTRGLNIARLAQLSVAGGSIRAIALHAAFVAAEAGTPVGMAEVLRAAAAEYAKQERPLTDTEIAGWT
jgi:hypothetical protein